MKQLTERLSDTATILDNIPPLLDLADDRELAILAALVRGYVECGGPGEWHASPGYLEWVAFAAFIKEGDEIDKDDAAENECSILNSGLDFMRRLRERGVGDHESFKECRLAISALGFARFGEPLDLNNKLGGERKPCSMRRAFELAIAEADAEEKQENEEQLEEAKRKRREYDREKREKEIQRLCKKPVSKLTDVERKRLLAYESGQLPHYNKIVRTMDRAIGDTRRRIEQLKKAAKPSGAVSIDAKRKAKGKRARKASRKAA